MAKILQKRRKILRAFALCFLSRAIRSAKELRSKEKKTDVNAFGSCDDVVL